MLFAILEPNWQLRYYLMCIVAIVDQGCDLGCADSCFRTIISPYTFSVTMQNRSNQISRFTTLGEKLIDGRQGERHFHGP